MSPRTRRGAPVGAAWHAARLFARLERRTRSLRRWSRGLLRRRVEGRRTLSLAHDVLDDAARGIALVARPARDVAAALGLAAAAGCHDTAATLAQAVVSRRHELGETERRRALRHAVGSWLATGDEAALSALVRDAAHELPEPLLRTIAALHPEPIAGPELLRASRPSLSEAMLLARAVERGELGPAELSALLRRVPWQHARRPELDLVLYNACRTNARDAARAALERYFSWHGLEAPRFGAAAFPNGVTFAATRPRPGPLVSVIMAAHRAAGTVRAAVDSLLAQSHQPIEVLVCDDDSPDETRQVLERAYVAEPRVRIFAGERRQGPYNVRNALLGECRGGFVAFQDADDVALPTRIARQLALLRRSGAEACYSNWLRVREDGSVVFFWDDAANRLCLPSLLMTRRALGAATFRPARFGADLEHRAELELRLGAGAVIRSRAPLVLGRWSAGSLTRSSGSESLETGYRAPARRAYADVVGRRALLGPERVPDAAVEAVLRRHELLLAPSPIRELGR